LKERGKMKKSRHSVRAKNLPFTVTYTVNDTKLKKRFDNPESAWKFMRETNGQLSMAFRTL
jgi:hypothetical protein